MEKELLCPPLDKLDCSVAKDRICIAKHHAIRAPKFARFLDNFWQGKSVKPLIMTWTDIESLMIGKNCKRQKWKFTADALTTNNIIKFDFEAVKRPFVTNYSIGLFRGIGQMDKPAYVEFYKAKNSKKKLTVIFRTIGSDDKTINFYDLSNDFP